MNSQEALAAVNLVPQKTPDYTFHKLILYEAVLLTQAKRVLETGTDVGDSARIFATALRRTNGVLFTIDRKTDLDLSWMVEYPNVMAIRGDSLQIPDDSPWKDGLDVLYIDSEHTKEQVLALADDAYCEVHRGYVGNMTYTIKGKNRRLSLTRFTEEKAWQCAHDRLAGKEPMLGEMV